MSLQVWLPLNGDIENRGCGDYIFTKQNSLIYEDSGKFQKSLGQGTILLNKNPLGLNGTICFWLYVDSNYNIAKGNILFGNSSTSAAIDNRKWSLFLYPDGNSLHSWGCMRDDMGGVNGSFSIDNCLPSDQWNHVVVAHDMNNQYIYVNGELIKTVRWDSSGNFTFNVTTAISPNNKTSGIKMNDLRLYDHCLSKNEIKEIYKCLTVHYTMNNQYNDNDNLLKGTKEWKNWLDKSSVIIEDEVLCMYASNQYPKYEPVKVTINEQYTVSVDAKADENFTATNGLILFDYLDSGNVRVKYDYGAGSFSTKWERKSWIITIPSNSRIDSLSLGVRATDNKRVYFKNLKLEKGAVLSPSWTPNPTDNLYSELGYDNTIEYDTSGYNNNGIIMNNPIYNIDSPLYNDGMVFNRENQNYIDLQETYITNQSTISFWGKVNSFGNWQRFFEFCNALQGQTGNHRILLGTFQGTNRLALHVYGGSEGTSNLYFNENLMTIDEHWHMYSIVFNKTNVKVFINGESVVDTTMTQELTSMVKQYSYIGKSSYSGDAYFDGSISDFRIYNTALNEDDILSLYQTKAKIDKDGNMFCNQYIEDNDVNTNLTKKSILNTKTLNENIGLYDMKTKILDDGSIWGRIFWHDYTISGNFNYETAISLGTKYVNENGKYSRLNELELFRNQNGAFEFLLDYPKVSETDFNRWIQTANPNSTVGGEGITQEQMGYETVSLSWTTFWKYGLAKGIGNGYISACAGLDCWWYSIGCYSWENGFART